jgi:hypothetical protein
MPFKSKTLLMLGEFDKKILALMPIPLTGVNCTEVPTLPPERSPPAKASKNALADT